MGSSESTASIRSIDRTTVEQHLNKMTKLESDISALTAENGVLKQRVCDSEIALAQELERNKKELLRRDGILRNTNDKNVCATKEDKLREENEHLKSQVSDLNKELEIIQKKLQQSSDQCQRNKEKHEKRCNTLNSQYCKVQSELERYKSNESTVKLSELYQQLQKLNSQVDATTKKLANELRTEERDANEDEFKKRLHDFNQYKQTLSKHGTFVSHPDLETAVRKYKDLNVENNRKTKDAMRKVYIIDRAAKSISEQLKVDTSNTIDNVKSIIEKHHKDLGELKQISFSNDFNQEEKLYVNAIELIHEQILHLDRVLTVVHPFDARDLKNNLNTVSKATPRKLLESEKRDSSRPQSSSSSSKEFNIIIYNFPESESAGNEEDVDLTNIKYFLGSFCVGNVNNITAQRLPANVNEKIRPVVVALPSYEAFKKILTSSHKVSESGLPNVKIVEYSGKTQDIDFDVWLNTRSSDSAAIETKSSAKRNLKKSKFVPFTQLTQ